MARIRFVNPAMKNYSGHFGSVMMKDGESVDHVSSAEVERLAAITKVELIHEDGTYEPAGLAHRMTRDRGLGAPVERKLKSEGKQDQRAEITPAPQDVKVREEPKTAEEAAAEKAEGEKEDAEKELDALAGEVEGEKAPAVTPGEKHTREELETIADTDGIAGLRKIAEPLNVKDKSITGLIEAILKAEA